MQSCQPLRLGRSLLRLKELHYAATLMIISLLSPPELFFFDRACVWVSKVPTCAFFVSVVLVAPQLIGVRVLNQLTSLSIQFNSHSYVSLARRLPFSIISNQAKVKS